MSDLLSEYLLFLAKTLTMLAALAAVLVALLATASRRSRRQRGPRVIDLNRRYDDLARSVRSRVLPRAALRRERSERKRRARAERRSRGGAVAPPRPRLFVLDFHGDLRATQVVALRREVTAVLTIATDRDEVLLRLENPGGLVQDQGLAASQLQRLRQRGIPLTVAVDTVAASGGYLMACVADRIVAAPFAVIGSIGVIAELPNVNRLLDRHGVDVEQFKGGDLKRTVTLLGRTEDVDRERMAAQIEDTHQLFKEFVAAHRPQLELDTVGTGQYWYGSRALDLHLVDELITSDDYLLRARDGADLFAISYAGPRRLGGRLARRLRSAVTDSLTGA